MVYYFMSINNNLNGLKISAKMAIYQHCLIHVPSLLYVSGELFVCLRLFMFIVSNSATCLK